MGFGGGGGLEDWPGCFPVIRRGFDSQKKIEPGSLALEFISFLGQK